MLLIRHFLHGLVGGLLFCTTIAQSTGCECHSSFSPSQLPEAESACIWRKALDSSAVTTATEALLKHFAKHKDSELRGDSGADIASFDGGGGGGVQRRLAALTEPRQADDSFVAFDSSAAAGSAVRAVHKAAGFPKALQALHSHYVEDGWPVVSIGGFGFGLPPHVPATMCKRSG